MPIIDGKSQKSFDHNVKAEMNSGKPPKQSLAIAYAIKRRAMKKMASGGMVKAPSEAMKKVMSKFMGYKKMSDGGLIDHDEPESMAEAPEYYDPDFLSDEEQDYALDQTYPDPDHKEDTEGMGKKGMLAELMERIRAKHRGL